MAISTKQRRSDKVPSSKRSPSRNRGKWSKIGDRVFTKKIIAVVLIFIIVGVGGEILQITSHAASSTWEPVYATNFPDPAVLSYGGKYYAFATNAGGQYIASAYSTDLIHWKKSSVNALPKLPKWAASNAVWAPSVTYAPGIKKFVMFYAAVDNHYAPGEHCISKAISSSPAGPYVDNSSGPFLCQSSLGGSIDPDIFYDSNGKAYLYVKNAGDAIHATDAIWVQPLTQGLAKTGHITKLLTTDQNWQGQTIEGPGMVKLYGGKYYLFYAGNSWDSDRYAIGYAVCSSPTGPCVDSPSNPFIGTSGTMLGPGSPAFFVGKQGAHELVFAAWDGSVNSKRAMYEATIRIRNGVPAVWSIQ